MNNNPTRNAINPQMQARIGNVDRVGENYKAPCINCQNLYGNIVHFTEGENDGKSKYSFRTSGIL